MENGKKVIYGFSLFLLVAFAFSVVVQAQNIAATITQSQPATYNGYKIFPLKGKNGQWAQIYLEDSFGNSLD